MWCGERVIEHMLKKTNKQNLMDLLSCITSVSSPQFQMHFRPRIFFVHPGGALF